MSDPQDMERMEEGSGNTAPTNSRFSGLCSSAEIVQLLQKVRSSLTMSSINK